MLVKTKIKKIFKNQWNTSEFLGGIKLIPNSKLYDKPAFICLTEENSAIWLCCHSQLSRTESLTIPLHNYRPELQNNIAEIANNEHALYALSLDGILYEFMINRKDRTKIDCKSMMTQKLRDGSSIVKVH